MGAVNRTKVFGLLVVAMVAITTLTLTLSFSSNDAQPVGEPPKPSFEEAPSQSESVSVSHEESPSHSNEEGSEFSSQPGEQLDKEPASPEPELIAQEQVDEKPASVPEEPTSESVSEEQTSESVSEEQTSESVSEEQTSESVSEEQTSESVSEGPADIQIADFAPPQKADEGIDFATPEKADEGVSNSNEQASESMTSELKPLLPEIGVGQTSRHTRLQEAITGASIVYDFKCISSSEGGNYIALDVRDDGSSYVTFDQEFPSVELGLGLIVTPGTKQAGEKGHGQPDNTTIEVSYGDTITFPAKQTLARFNKGGPTAGAPLWDSSTGNPYIYFVAANGWTCSLVDPEDSDEFCPKQPECSNLEILDLNSCEAMYGGKSTNQDVGSCVFRANHYFTKNPRSSPEDDLEMDGPPRFRHFGDIFAGRCGSYHDEDYSDFSIKCCSTTLDDDSIFMAPACQSVNHNIAFGMSTGIVGHHRIVASQISPHKFVGCSSGDACATSTSEFTCSQGAGPHETFRDDLCFSAPPSGVFIDKSAGFSAKQTDVTPCEFTEDGSFTSCGVGGNPCITKYTCEIEDGSPCIGEDEYDIIEEIDCQGCHGGAGKYGGIEGACQCSEIQHLVQEITGVPCHSGDEDGEDEDDTIEDEDDESV